MRKSTSRVIPIVSPVLIISLPIRVLGVSYSSSPSWRSLIHSLVHTLLLHVVSILLSMLILQSCIFLQKCTNSSIDWLQLFKTLAGNLDWVSSSRQDGEVMPRCGFSRVVDPVRFAIHISENDLGSTKVKLLDFHRYLLSSMGLFHCSIVVGLWGQ